MPTLNGTQLTALQAELTANDVAGFYALLESYGDPYGRLGAGVTDNDTWQGALANGFVQSGASDDSVDLSHGSTAWTDLNSDLAARYLAAYNTNSGVTPSWSQVQALHNAAYFDAGLDNDDWFVNKLLNDSGDPAALWADFMSNTSSYDLMGDALTVAESGAALLFGPYLAYQALADANGLDQAEMEFAQNFLRALASTDQTLLEDMALDLVSGPIVDLVNAIKDIPDALGNFLSKLPNTLADFLPNSLAGWVPGVMAPYGTGEAQISPIVLDVDASGTIELVALNAAGSVLWDIDQDGFREVSGWITGGDGLLCIDLNSDGIINDHGELFGGANGYNTLDAYDTNNNNTITSADTQFGDLRVWVDSNADGYSQSTELHTLSSLGITSIATTYSNVNYDIAGNHVSYQSTFVMNGNTYTSVDAFFSYDNVNSEYGGDYTLDVRTLFLPDLRGYGALPDLHIAMSEDETLLDMVHDLTLSYADAALTDLQELQNDVMAILYRWAGVDGVSPTSRGLYFNGQDLGFLEAFMDDGFNQYPGNVYDPWPNASVYLREALYNAYSGFSARLLAQIDTGNLFSTKPSYNPVTDEFDGDFTLNFTHIETLLAGDNEGAVDSERMKDVAALLRIVDSAIGFENLSAGDREDLDGLLLASDPMGVFNVDAFDYFFHQNPHTIAAGDANNNIIIATGVGGTTQAYGGNDAIFGTSAQEAFYGGDGNDTLIGGVNRDHLYGDDGDDTFVFNLGDSNISSGTETLTESTGQGIDTIQFGAGIAPEDIRFWTGANGLAQIYYSATDYILMYGAYNATTGATEFYNNIERIAFADDTVWNLTQGLTLRASDSSGGQVFGSALNDTITGSILNDDLRGYAGNDTLIGGIRVDALTGGLGDDTYVFNIGDSNTSYGYGEVVYESAGEGADTYRFGAGVTPGNLQLFTGASGQLYCYYSATDYFTLYGTYDAVTGESKVQAHIERIEFNDATVWDFTQGLTLRGTIQGETIRGSSLVDVIDGNSGADELRGYGGNDTLDGGAGNDNIIGGSGTDTASYLTATAGVTVNLATTTAQNTIGWGTDTLSGIENLTGSSFNDTLTGDANVNSINGDAGDDTIEGGAGNDVLAGGNGTDRVSYAAATAAVTVNLATLTAQNTVGAGTDTLSGFENLLGSAFNDTLTGNASANVIEGGAGNDIINSAGGIDTVSYASATVAVTVNLTTTTAQNTVGAGTDTITNTENLTGSAFNDTLTGNGSANLIEGGAGNDIMNGSTGTDTLTYVSATAGVTVNLTTTTAQNTVGAGTDTISAFENLTGSAFNDTLTGTASANVIEGGAGNDVINAAGGTDTVTYATATTGVTVSLAITTAQNTIGAGTDTITNTENLTGSAYNDILTGSTAVNTLTGGDGDDALYGGSGNDILWGGNGADTLSGQAGLDTLNGDAGADTFLFEAASAYSNVDVINGFTLAQSDRLDLSDLLDLYNPLTQAITDYVQITTSGSNSSLFVDRDGLAATYGFVQIGMLNGVTGLTDEAALVTSGNLIVV